MVSLQAKKPLCTVSVVLEDTGRAGDIRERPSWDVRCFAGENLLDFVREIVFCRYACAVNMQPCSRLLQCNKTECHFEISALCCTQLLTGGAVDLPADLVCSHKQKSHISSHHTVLYPSQRNQDSWQNQRFDCSLDNCCSSC